MSEQTTELKDTFDSLWRSYVECDVEELAPSGLRLREELVGYINSLSQGGTPFTQLEAERDIYRGLVKAATLFNRTYLTGDGKTVVASWDRWVDFDKALRDAAALSEQEEKE